MVGTHLKFDSEVYQQLQDIQKSYNLLNPTLQRRWEVRNGFSVCGFKDFFESAIMVMVTLGRVTGDIVVQDGSFVINCDNFLKKSVFRDLSIPQDWRSVGDWRIREFEKYKKF